MSVRGNFQHPKLDDIVHHDHVVSAVDAVIVLIVLLRKKNTFLSYSLMVSVDTRKIWPDPQSYNYPLLFSSLHLSHAEDVFVLPESLVLFHCACTFSGFSPPDN